MSNPNLKLLLNEYDKKRLQAELDLEKKLNNFYIKNPDILNINDKMDLIEDARDEAMMASQKPYKSALKPLISALAVKTGQLGSDSIWNTKINMLL